MEREQATQIVSSLKIGTTEAEAVEFLKNRGFEIDWTAIGSQPTNLFEVWYLCGPSGLDSAGLSLKFYANTNMSFERWKIQHPTNSALVSAGFYWGGTNYKAIALTEQAHALLTVDQAELMALQLANKKFTETYPNVHSIFNTDSPNNSLQAKRVTTNFADGHWTFRFYNEAPRSHSFATVQLAADGSTNLVTVEHYGGLP